MVRKFTQQDYDNNSASIQKGNYDNIKAGWDPLDDLVPKPCVHETADGKLVEYEVAFGKVEDQIQHVARARLVSERGVETVVYHHEESEEVSLYDSMRNLNSQLGVSLKKSESEMIKERKELIDKIW